MTDIVERLRALSAYKHDDLSIGEEAANEIESLREHCIHLEAKASGYTGLIELLAECQAREAKLREELKYAVDCVEEWGAYADDYFKNKWGLDQDIDRINNVLKEKADDSALQEALKQARKEALLEAARWFGENELRVYPATISMHLKKIAEE